jgi:hypothetical protein
MLGREGGFGDAVACGSPAVDRVENEQAFRTSR